MINNIKSIEQKLIKVSKYITESWSRAIQKNNVDPEFVMPFDFIPPCIAGKPGVFTQLFYWDTYFTNKGLYIDGMEKYAYGNIENLKFALRQFGCVPNMCRKTGADYASQPPLLVFMVKDYYDFSKDIEFLSDSFNALEIEYSFWMAKRISPTGLNRWGGNYDYKTNIPKDTTSYLNERTGERITCSWEEIVKYYENSLAQGESGEDNTQRYLMRATEINAVDLNSYLYGFEILMAEFSKILGKDSEIWLQRANKRKKLMDKYLLDKETGIYFDYIFTDKKLTKIYCVDNYTPIVFGLSADKSAVEKINEMLIKEHGVVSTNIPSINGEKYQWGFPNVWAPHQYWAFVANLKVENEKKANEIVLKYLNTAADEFAKTNALYEKYDGIKGGKAIVNEYGIPEMLGWTAGIYQKFFKHYENLI